MWLEMSRDPTHGGAGWEFGTCVWSPSRKQQGGRWPFWELLLKVRLGDTIFHLRGVVAIGEEVRSVRMRIGQERFSAEVRKNYGWRCCFPDCEVIDPVLLVGSHIGRWSDALELRGDVSNGLCLCLMHDKAFENGLYTLDRSMKVRINPVRISSVRWANKNLQPFDGRSIRSGSIVPDPKALGLHWERIGFAPKG